MSTPKALSAHALSEQIVSQGVQKGITVSGAESCTGGLIAKYLTDIPGSSALFCGACVTYTNEIKQKLLGVDPTVIEQYTEVSYACAEAMAQGARRTFGTTVAYSTTGYAGPGGGTERDPVGTVYIGISTAEGTVSDRLALPQDATREEIREAAARAVLEKLATLTVGKEEL